MPKRKYTQAERERLGIASSKRKGSTPDRTLRIRKEYLDFDDDRPRRRESAAADDDGMLSWIGAAAVGLIMLALLGTVI